MSPVYRVEGWSLPTTLSLSLSLSLCPFPGRPGIAGYIGAKDDVSGGDNWSSKTCKAAVKSSSPTKPTPSFLQAGCPFGYPANIVKALKGKSSVIIIFMG